MKPNEKIKLLRSKVNWTQKDLVIACGVSQSEVSKIENGTIVPPPEILKKIEEALRQKLQELNKGNTFNSVNVIKPQSDEEALIYRYYIRFAELNNSDERYSLFKQLYDEMSVHVQRKENFLRDLNER